MSMNRLQKFLIYFVFTAWSAIVFFPLWTLIVDSFKPQKEIFSSPFGLPQHFTLDGYKSVWLNGKFGVYFLNTFYVTIISLALIVFFGSLASYALAKK